MLNDSEDDRDTLVREASTRRRIVQKTHFYPRNAPSIVYKGCIGPGTRHSRLFVRGHIGRGRNTLHPYRLSPSFLQLSWTRRLSVSFFYSLCPLWLEYYKLSPLSPRGMTWRKYKLLILPNASFSDGPFQAYCMPFGFD
jgi:hypothetical protein